MIVNTRCSDIGVSKPFLHLRNVGLMIESVRGSGRAQRMRADLKSERGRVGAHQLVNAIGRNRLIQLAGSVVANWPEQRAAIVLAVPGCLKIVVNERMSTGM